MNMENETTERSVQPRGDIQVHMITDEEMVKALRKMMHGKAVEAWKFLGSIGIDYLTEVFTKVMEKEEIPEEKRSCTPIPIFKTKGQHTEWQQLWKNETCLTYHEDLGKNHKQVTLREKVSISDQLLVFYAQQEYPRRHFRTVVAHEEIREDQEELYCVCRSN